MRTHTNNYKNEIKTLGREIDAKITFDGTTYSSEDENPVINGVSLHYEGAILKSVMKQLDLDLNIDIPVNTILTAQFGVKVNGVYEYIDLGTFVAYKSEKQENNNSYKITCYDKMLYSMKNYETLTGVTYPITIRNYINAICSHLGLTFTNAGDTFANYDKTISSELYLSYNEEEEKYESLGYTFRDVLDELAEVTASTICVDGDNLEIRYINTLGTRTQVSGSSININDAMHEGFLYNGVNNISVSGNLPAILEFGYLKDTNAETIDEEFLKDINVNFGEKYGAVNTIALTRAEADTIAQSIPSNLADEDKIAIEIKNNQIMNFDDRGDYIPDILNKLYGLEYYLNDFTSTGITYLDLCDKYYVKIGDNTYPCIMFNDDINITQGLEENVYTEKPEEAEVEYKYTTETDKAVREAGIIIDKKISQVDIKGKTINLTADDISIASNNFNVDVNGNLQCSNAEISGEITASSGAIGGYEISKSENTNYISAQAYPKYNFDIYDYLKVKDYLDGTGTLTPVEEIMYDIDGDGQVTEIDMQFIYRMVELHIDTGQGIHVQLMSNPGELNMNGFSVLAGYMTVFSASPMWGVTVDNGRVWGERILYDSGGSSGETGTVTLFDQIDDDLGLIFDTGSYKYIEIFGVDNNLQLGAYMKITKALANGDSFTLSMEEATSNGTYIRRTKYTVANDNELVPSNYGYVYINQNGVVSTNSSQNYIKITKVIGYK